MGVNCGYYVFMASRSNADLRTAIQEFSATLIQGNAEYPYSNFFTFNPPSEPDDRGVFEVAAEDVHRYQLGPILKADLAALQAKFPSVFIALYERDAEFDTIGSVMTGVKQWNLMLGDGELAMQIVFADEEP